MAARAGQMEVVRCLLRNGALVDAMARVSQLSHLQSSSQFPSVINTVNEHILSTGLHTHMGDVTCLISDYYMSVFFSFHSLYLFTLFSFFLCVFHLNLNMFYCFYPSIVGGPDSSPHCFSSGENRYCPVAAAAHGPPRCCYHQWLHSPSHFSQGGPGGDSCRATGSWSLTFYGHKGEQRTGHDIFENSLV